MKLARGPRVLLSFGVVWVQNGQDNLGSYIWLQVAGPAVSIYSVSVMGNAIHRNWHSNRIFHGHTVIMKAATS